MRILRLCSVFEPPDASISGQAASYDPIGGMQTHTAELTRALDEHGHQQVVVTAYRPGAPSRSRLGRHTTLLRLGLPVTYMRQCYALPAARAVLSAAAGADVLHAHVGEDLAVIPIAMAAARRHRVSLVLTLHSSLAHTLRVVDARSFTLKVLGGLLEHRGTCKAAAMITLTPRLADLLVDHGVPGDRVHVIPSGVSPSVFAAVDGDPLAGIPRPRVVYVGRLHRQKGVDVLVRAAVLLRRVNAHVVLVGDGPQRAQLERQASRLGVADRVHILGFVPHSLVPSVLRSADLLVLPSRYEELGTVLVEAMWAGTPIVASNTGGIPHLVADGVHGLLVPPEDPSALAQAAARVLANRSLAAGLVEHGIRRAHGFSWDHLAAQVSDVYERVIMEDVLVLRGRLVHRSLASA
jgi:glycosyltransferase involved in cell wall biosynthesis